MTIIEPSFDELIIHVTDSLRTNKKVHEKLSGEGYIHIDRQLPFLCVYREPEEQNDPGTAELLTSQASYLLEKSNSDFQHKLNALIYAIAKQENTVFGGFLLLEMWAADTAPQKSPGHAFRIAAPSLHPPSRLLETMENALLRVTANRQTPEIQLDYMDQVAPPELPPLLSSEQLATVRCISLGLEINPVYRDQTSEELYVPLFKVLRQRLNRALKRVFYDFSRHFTTHRPAHFHELGPRAVTRTVYGVDKGLAEISDDFDLLLHVSPINSEQAWQRFQQYKFEKKIEFLYRPRTIDISLMKRRLFKIPIERIEDPTLAHIFSAKRNELDRQLTLIADRNTPRFLLGSRQLFSDPEPGLLALSDSLLESLDLDEPLLSADDCITIKHFVTHAQEELKYYQRQDPTLNSHIELRQDIPGIMVSKGNFLIGANAQIETHRIAATLAHEISTHVLTWHNGRQQPFRELYSGMANYEPLQEGLAVLSEYLVGGLSAARLRQLAGRVLAVQLITDGASFIETFRTLHHEQGFGPKASFMMTMRTFRGGGYTKDAIYLQGLTKLLDYLAQGNSIEPLYLGKIAHEQIPLIDELRWRHVLKAPRLLPRFFDFPKTKDRLTKLANGMTVRELAAGEN